MDSCFILNLCTFTISTAFSKEIHSFHEQMGKHTLGWALGMLMNFLSREPSCTGKAHLPDKGILTQISSGYKPTNTEVEGVPLFTILAFFFFLPATFHSSAPLAQSSGCTSAGLFRSASEATSAHLQPLLKAHHTRMKRDPAKNFSMRKRTPQHPPLLLEVTAGSWEE